MSKINRAIEQAKTRLPFGCAVVIAVKKGKIEVMLNHLDKDFHVPINMDATIPDQIEAVIEDAIEMYGQDGPRLTCVNCGDDHDNFPPFCDKCAKTYEKKNQGEIK